MDNQSIQHTRWNCTYHIVFIPKYRRKIMYGSNKKDLVEIIKKLCEMKGVALIEGKVCGSYPYVCGNSSEAERIGIHVLSEGKKFPDVFRSPSGVKAQMGRPTFLGERVLRCDSRKRERRDDT